MERDHPTGRRPVGHPQLPLIVFVMGGSGCGKGTQCKYMATKYGFCHVGLLQQEAQWGTQWGRKIHDLMLQGDPGVPGVILDVISICMLSCPESQGFLIDSFPQELRQAKELSALNTTSISSLRSPFTDAQVGWAPNIIITFACSMVTMMQRAPSQGQAERRADDCEAALRQHLETYYTLYEPVLTFYQRKSLLPNLRDSAPVQSVRRASTQR
ncbi:adenylate kinase isoenzyme 1-like [Bos javanicus]|uniref:adenylate kinase isoenzyme 1-like n=1 Tax=Bos javanicus TaxID=9906 RepID=UPI002AA91277|nr:adenylate kinase isoenzyme 1-like [Bos javanicus]